MVFSLQVSDEAFEYLRLQKGSLDGAAHDRAAWHRLYEEDLRATYEAIAPFLPTRPVRSEPMHVLDIGSGLGGIDVLIRRHYGGVPLEVTLLDGVDDPPVMKLHAVPFNNMRVAKEFQWANGLDPADFHWYAPEVATFARRFDVVVSFGAWCFHFPPSVYLPRLCAGGLHYRSVIICDVRRNKTEWMRELEKVFDLVTMVTLRPKWSRCVFKPKEAP